MSYCAVPHTHRPVGFGCGAGDRCYGVADTHTPFSLGNSSSCNHACPVLATNEWLANDKYWTMEQPANVSVVAANPTVLKKSEIESGDLLPSQLKRVQKGFRCHLTGAATHAAAAVAVHGYYVCS